MYENFTKSDKLCIEIIIIIIDMVNHKNMNEYEKALHFLVVVAAKARKKQAVTVKDD